MGAPGPRQAAAVGGCGSPGGAAEARGTEYHRAPETREHCEVPRPLCTFARRADAPARPGPQIIYAGRVLRQDDAQLSSFLQQVGC